MTNLEEVVWCQEEPKNNGAWFFVERQIEEALTRPGKPGMRPAMPGAKPPPRPPPASPSATRRSRKRWSPTRWACDNGKAASRSDLQASDSCKETGTHGHRSQSPHARRIGHRGDHRRMAEAARRRRSKRDEPIASLETDKVAVEVPSPVAGVMGEHKVAVGDTVEVGAVIATVEEGARRRACRSRGTRPSARSRAPSRRCARLQPPRQLRDAAQHAVARRAPRGAGTRCRPLDRSRAPARMAA